MHHASNSESGVRSTYVTHALAPQPTNASVSLINYNDVPLIVDSLVQISHDSRPCTINPCGRRRCWYPTWCELNFSHALMMCLKDSRNKPSPYFYRWTFMNRTVLFGPASQNTTNAQGAFLARVALPHWYTRLDPVILCGGGVGRTWGWAAIGGEFWRSVGINLLNCAKHVGFRCYTDTD